MDVRVAIVLTLLSLGSPCFAGSTPASVLTRNPSSSRAQSMGWSGASQALEPVQNSGSALSPGGVWCGWLEGSVIIVGSWGENLCVAQQEPEEEAPGSDLTAPLKVR